MAIVPFKSSVEQWRDLFVEQGPDLPTDFLLAWLNEESGGNPCATGLTQPDKFEAGIFQTMHPQDDRYGATVTDLRAGCSGQTLVDPSLVNRTLQVSAGLNLVRDYVGRAQAALLGSGVSWSPDSTDFWTAVKQFHALPCVVTSLLPRVVRRFGPPADWQTFKAQAFQLDPQDAAAGCGVFWTAPSLHGLRNRVEDTMANAEESGKFGGGVRAQVAKLGAAGPFLLLGAAGALIYFLWRR